MATDMGIYLLVTNLSGVLPFCPKRTKQINPAVTCAAVEHQGRRITCKRLNVLRKAGRLQLIQNLAPSVAGRRQCCIRIKVLFDESH
jgi:hypothetical protein